MSQLGFFDADKRLAALSAKGDPLEAHRSMAPWERFRTDIETVVLTLSFTQFLRLGIEDSIPDATTLWLFREKLARGRAY
jgi:hypothetical protein